MFIGFAGGFYKEVKELNRKNYSELLWLMAIILITIFVLASINTVWVFKNINFHFYYSNWRIFNFKLL
ncbi:MAG: hypothetical protein KatS3mg002_1284 [Candidatus Woesearchaeota archaeon]|nr:MAG: hypothetical protein KatS3mg002_1284 [Candidatus Woesearchaeota archaeon]